MKCPEGAEHGTVFHIMSVNNGIAVFKIAIIGIVNENGTGGIIIPFKGMFQIILIVRPLHNRVTDRSAFYLNPADNIRVNGFRLSNPPGAAQASLPLLPARSGFPPALAPVPALLR